MFFSSSLSELDPCFCSRFTKILASDCATSLKHKTIFAARINSDQTFLSPHVGGLALPRGPTMALRNYSIDINLRLEDGLLLAFSH
jgi:hypothetical protein